jgi:NAD(P)-dependent dehydrogenase (short-subunit alcohol dehydrogenase family)
MQNKSIFVTGGNSGIGLATALVFARAGADIAIFARRAEHNEKARALIEAEGRRCLTFSGEVSDETAIRDAVAATMRSFGGLHYGFNNAGTNHPAVPITELSVADCDRQMDVNVKGTFLGMKYMIPAIKASGGGAICNNASTGGIAPTACQALYAAAKAAVIGMTKVAALECAKDGVRVNVVCPGATTGEMFHRFAEANPERAAMAVSKHPLGRIGDKEEVASAVLFLCRDATFTTGHAFVVDGGRLLN